MLELLARQERVLERELTQALECSDEELRFVSRPLSEDGLALLCLNISGGPSSWQITARGRDVLRAEAERESS